MKKKKKKIILFIYNRFFDPLVHSNFWPFIKVYLENQEDNPYQFCVVSYEDKNKPLSDEEKKKMEKWRELGLDWRHLKWHPGIGSLNKARDILNGFITIMTLRLKGYKYIVALASVAGSFAYLYSLFTGLKLFLYSYEPHSEYALDNKMWPEKSRQFRIANYLEKKSAYSASVISSGTRFMEERLKKEWRVKAEFIKIPSVVDDKKFVFSERDRMIIREKLGISATAWVLYYPGKFGDLYYKQETANMYKWLKAMDNRFHLLIVTPHTKEEIFQIFDSAGVERSAYTITHSNYDEIHVYASASDMGIIAVPPGPSKKFISNIKVGEYLCAGLPYLITRGVSEDYQYAIEQKVGIVVDKFDEESIKGAYPQIKEYMEMEPEERRKHCRKIGVEYRGFEKLNKCFWLAIQKLTDHF